MWIIMIAQHSDRRAAIAPSLSGQSTHSDHLQHSSFNHNTRAWHARPLRRRWPTPTAHRRATRPRLRSACRPSHDRRPAQRGTAPHRHVKTSTPARRRRSQRCVTASPAATRRHHHSTLSLADMGYHPCEIYTGSLRSSIPFSVQMTSATPGLLSCTTSSCASPTGATGRAATTMVVLEVM